MQQNILMVYFENSTKSSCNTLFKLTTHRKTTAVKVIRDEKKKEKKSTLFECQCIKHESTN